MTITQTKIPVRAEFYSRRYPERPPLSATEDWLTGTWAVGAMWGNSNNLHGAYPRTYLERIHTLFPDAANVLHVFSGGLQLEEAQEAATFKYADDFGVWMAEPLAMELVDKHGPDEGRYPTRQCDVLELPEEWTGRFDLILADPPYTKADAMIYGDPMPNRGKVTSALRRVCSPGGCLVWLDTVWPMHRKVDWKIWGHIGLVRSTNHRVRMVSMFQAVGD